VVSAYGTASRTLVQGTVQVVSLGATPTGVTPGSSITLVARGFVARGFAAGEIVDLGFNPGTFYVANPPVIGQATADATGAATLTAPLPSVVNGQNVGPGAASVTAHGRTNGYNATAPVTVLASALSVTPSGGAAGAQVTVTAQGAFARQEAVFFYWDGDNAHGLFLGGTVAGYGGSLYATVALPSDAPGPHRLYAYGLLSGALISGPYQALGLTLTPSSGPTGTPATAALAGFAPGEAVRLR